MQFTEDMSVTSLTMLKSTANCTPTKSGRIKTVYHTTSGVGKTKNLRSSSAFPWLTVFSILITCMFLTVSVHTTRRHTSNKAKISLGGKRVHGVRLHKCGV